jgi:hypothetical protein
MYNQAGKWGRYRQVCRGEIKGEKKERERKRRKIP